MTTCIDCNIFIQCVHIIMYSWYNPLSRSAGKYTRLRQSPGWVMNLFQRHKSCCDIHSFHGLCAPLLKLSLASCFQQNTNSRPRPPQRMIMFCLQPSEVGYKLLCLSLSWLLFQCKDIQLCTKLSFYSFNLAWLEEDHHFGVITLIATLLSLIVVLVVALIAALLCAVVARVRRHKTGMQICISCVSISFLLFLRMSRACTIPMYVCVQVATKHKLVIHTFLARD